MQGISNSTLLPGHPIGLRRSFLAVGTIVALAGIWLMMAAQAAASVYPIVVTVSSDLDPNHHKEGVPYTFVIATFTDDNACTAPDVCNAVTDYNVNIRWGDNSAVNVPATLRLAQSGNAATYRVDAPHSYGDENNCVPDLTCGFNVQILVTNKLNSTTSDPNLGNGQIAVKDQPLSSNAGNTFSAINSTPFSGVIGSFQDGNHLAASSYVGDLKEFVINIQWGDGTVDTTSGSVSIGPCNPTTSGTGVGEGCHVDVRGIHTYTHYGQYTVTVSISDGSHPAASWQSTANVVEFRGGVVQSAGTPGTRAANPAPANGPGPRIAHLGPSTQTQRTAASSTSAKTPDGQTSVVVPAWPSCFTCRWRSND